MAGDFDTELEQYNKGVGDFDHLLPETPKQSYKEYAPTLREKVNAVGYSGLSDADKEIFKSQYPSSQASKTMSFDDVVKYIDDEARKKVVTLNSDNLKISPSLPSVQSLDTPKEWTKPELIETGLPGEYSLSYGDVRKVLSVPASVVAGTWNRFTGEGGDIGGEKEIIPEIERSFKRANAGKGIEGVMSDPLNATMLVPGLGEYVMATKLGKMAQKTGPVLGESLIRGIAGAGEGAGYGALSLLDDTKDNTADEAIGYSAGFGGGFGSASGLLKGFGKKWFPGISSQTNRAVDPETKELVKQNLDQILGRGLFPKTKEGFYDLADAERDILSESYDRAVKAVNPKNMTWEEYKAKIMENISKNPQFSRLTDDIALKTAAKTQFENPQFASEVDMPFMRNIEDLKDKLKKSYEKRMAKRYAVSDAGIGLLDKDIQSVIRSKVIDNPDNPIYTADELGWIRTAKTNPETYKDPVAETSMNKKDLGRTWRDVVNAELESDPRYAEHITKKVKDDYRLWSSLEDVLDAPGRLGLGDRVPFGLSLSPYLKSSATFKLGQGLVAPQKMRFGTRNSED